MSSLTPLEGALGLLMQVFNKYASMDGKTDTLSRAEVKTLIKQEWPNLAKVADCFYLCNWSFISQFDLEECSILNTSLYNMSCLQAADFKNQIEDMFVAMENESGEVDFCGFMFHVATLGVICHSVLDVTGETQ